MTGAQRGTREGRRERTEERGWMLIMVLLLVQFCHSPSSLLSRQL
jgi:hypothetical protein